MAEQPESSLIGSYTAPDETPKPVQEKSSPTTAGSMAAGIEEDLTHSVKETESTAEKSQNYEEILKEHNITVEDAKSIVDDMLTQGFYVERINLTSKMSVDLRTRTHGDYLRYHNALEALNPRFEDGQQEIALRYCLAGSLARFKSVEFNFPKLEDASHDELTNAFDKRLDWIEKQPERLIALLATKLNAFDRKVSVVMSEGVIENF